MKLHPRTAATLETLRQVEWFRSIGHTDSKLVVTVASWEEAVDWSGDGTWEDIQLEAANQVSEALQAKSPADFRRWNEAVHLVKPLVTDLVQEKTREVVERERLDAAYFEKSVQWDILNLALEAEFSDVIAPGFFAQLGYWYERGNWPCGWDGPMDTGRLVVF